MDFGPLLTPFLIIHRISEADWQRGFRVFTSGRKTAFASAKDWRSVFKDRLFVGR